MKLATKRTVQSLAFATFAMMAAESGAAEDSKPPVLANAEDAAIVTELEHGDGMWVYYVPKGVHGAFDSYDPIGLIAGALIKSDCSVRWTDKTGKLYCFATESSLIYFKGFPQANIRKATAAWQHMAHLKPQS